MDLTHPWTHRAARNGVFSLGVAQDVATVLEKDAFLAEQADKDHNEKQAGYGSGPSRGQT
jgi:hypothetical protein